MTVRLPKRLLTLAIACFMLGALWMVALRFVLVQKKEVHYHGNFAVFLNGQRQKFDNFTYYEEIQACSGDASDNPRTRVHMHDQVDHIVHVHENGVTWGHFFANLGWSLGPDYVQSRDTIYRDGNDTQELTFKLNGEVLENAKATNLYNSTIKSEDVLLISYGSEDTVAIDEQYNQITKDAGEYNSKNDPSSCSGGKPLTIAERLKTALKFWE